MKKIEKNGVIPEALYNEGATGVRQDDGQW